MVHANASIINTYTYIYVYPEISVTVYTPCGALQRFAVRQLGSTRQFWFPTYKATQDHVVQGQV